jgi:hypothetical protein
MVELHATIQNLSSILGSIEYEYCTVHRVVMPFFSDSSGSHGADLRANFGCSEEQSFRE